MPNLLVCSFQLLSEAVRILLTWSGELGNFNLPFQKVFHTVDLQPRYSECLRRVISVCFTRNFCASLWVIYHNKTKWTKNKNRKKMEWNQENLTCDSITVQTILVHISEEENYLGAFLFPIVSLLCPSQPTRLPSNPSWLTAEMTSWGQDFLQGLKLSEVQAVHEKI